MLTIPPKLPGSRIINLQPLHRLLFLFLLPSPLTLQAQEVHPYEISLAGFTIGEMTATRYERADTTFYLLESKVSFWLFGQIEVDYKTEVYYQDGKFIRSLVQSNTNRGNFLSRIWWENDRYLIRAQAYKYEHQAEFADPILHSAVRLFFEEPIEINKMMAENYGKFASVTPLGDGVYDTCVEGNENRYYYKNGKLQKASMDSPIKNYVIERKEP